MKVKRFWLTEALAHGLGLAAWRRKAALWYLAGLVVGAVGTVANMYVSGVLEGSPAEKVILNLLDALRARSGVRSP